MDTLTSAAPSGILAKFGQLDEARKQREAAQNQLKARHNALKAPVYQTGASPTQVLGNEFVAAAPNVRHGENTMSSRGFSFCKMFAFLRGIIPAEQAQVEINMARTLKTKLADGAGFKTWTPQQGEGMSVMCPLGADYLPAEYLGEEFIHEVKQMCYAGVRGADIDEMNWVRRKHYRGQGKAITTPQSWLNETLGGALVAPPEMGELITLLRNREAMVNAGARVVPLPPQGRLVFPRQTSAASANWLGENTLIPSSTLGTGTLELSAKKLAVLVAVPNELIRFASPAAEAVLRDDMTKDLALTLDLACLEGTGSSYQPLGLVNYPNINVVTSSVTGAAGNSIVGQDAYRVIETIEESNAEFECWIMRPKTLYNYYQLRSSAITANDSNGPFLFNLVREAGDDTPPMLGGYPVVKSTQVSRTRVGGSASNLTYVLGGMFSDYIIGMFGAIEFAATTLGDTSFQTDQTWVRGILNCDGAPRRPASFCLLDQLIAS